MNTNRILGLIILTCCLLLLLYFIFPDFLSIRERLESWIYGLFFVVPVLLLIVSNRFKKIGDITGRNISYWATLSFVGIVAFPVIVFFFNFLFLGIDLPDFILVIFPIISSVLSLIVVYRLFINIPIVKPINSILEHPYK